MEGGHNERQSAGGGGQGKKKKHGRARTKKAKMRRTHTGNSVTANRMKLTNGGFFCAISPSACTIPGERKSQRARGAPVEAAGSKRYEWTNQWPRLKDDKPKNEQASRLFFCLGRWREGTGNPCVKKEGRKEKDGGDPG
ncbi:hypothetical protein HDV62DRAFT_210232 [Trichoderma sp. SZMC 28011]